jgi:hypothetical protein
MESQVGFRLFQRDRKHAPPGDSESLVLGLCFEEWFSKEWSFPLQSTTSASAGNLLEMKNLRLGLRQTESETLEVRTSS